MKKLIHDEIEPYLSQSGKTAELMLRIGFERLSEIHKHYARKEYLFFPHLEKKGIDAPPKVMWAKDDETRADIKAVLSELSKTDHDEIKTKDMMKQAIHHVREMIFFKEDNILIPLLLEELSFFDWVMIDSATEEIGYFINPPKYKWTDKVNAESDLEEKPVKEMITGEIPFDAWFSIPLLKS